MLYVAFVYEVRFDGYNLSRGISDKITYKPYNQGEQWLLPPSLDELVPQNHFIRIVSKTVDELEIDEVFA